MQTQTIAATAEPESETVDELLDEVKRELAGIELTPEQREEKEQQFEEIIQGLMEQGFWVYATRRLEWYQESYLRLKWSGFYNGSRGY